MDIIRMEARKIQWQDAQVGILVPETGQPPAAVARAGPLRVMVGERNDRGVSVMFGSFYLKGKGDLDQIQFMLLQITRSPSSDSVSLPILSVLGLENGLPCLAAAFRFDPNAAVVEQIKGAPASWRPDAEAFADLLTIMTEVMGAAAAKIKGGKP